MSRTAVAPSRWRLGREDRGAALIVAIGFVLMIGAITAGLSSLVTSSMNNRVSLQTVRDREYAADAAIEDAIVDVRALIDAGSTTCSDDGASTTSAVNEFDVRVDWVPACEAVVGVEGVVVVQHNVVFAACRDSAAPCADDATIIAARVNFQQRPDGSVAHTFIQSWSVGR